MVVETYVNFDSVGCGEKQTCKEARKTLWRAIGTCENSRGILGGMR